MIKSMMRLLLIGRNPEVDAWVVLEGGPAVKNWIVLPADLDKLDCQNNRTGTEQQSKLLTEDHSRDTSKRRQSDISKRIPSVILTVMTTAPILILLLNYR